jgi:hypothetical protein
MMHSVRLSQLEIQATGCSMIVQKVTGRFHEAGAEGKSFIVSVLFCGHCESSMSMSGLLLAWGVGMVLRVGFLTAHLNNLEGLWAEYARRGLLYRLAQIIDLVTLIGFGACAVFTLWTLPAREADALARTAAVFVVWLGIGLLDRLAVHRFPRTDSPAFFADAKVCLISNVVTAAVGALAMTGGTALYFWLRGG